MSLKIAIVDDNSFLIHAIKEKLSFFGDIFEKPATFGDSISIDLYLKLVRTKNPILISNVRIIEYKLSKPKPVSGK